MDRVALEASDYIFDIFPAAAKKEQAASTLQKQRA
jgi:hypothetical protein